MVFRFFGFLYEEREVLSRCGLFAAPTPGSHEKGECLFHGEPPTLPHRGRGSSVVFRRWLLLFAAVLFPLPRRAQLAAGEDREGAVR